MGVKLITSLLAVPSFCVATLVTVHDGLERKLRTQLDGAMARAGASPYHLNVTMFDGCSGVWGYSFTTTHRMQADLDGRPQYLVGEFCADFRSRPTLVSVSSITFPK